MKQYEYIEMMMDLQELCLEPDITEGDKIMTDDKLFHELMKYESTADEIASMVDDAYMSRNDRFFEMVGNIYLDTDRCRDIMRAKSPFYDDATITEIEKIIQSKEIAERYCFRYLGGSALQQVNIAFGEPDEKPAIIPSINQKNEAAKLYSEYLYKITFAGNAELYQTFVDAMRKERKVDAAMALHLVVLHEELHLIENYLLTKICSEAKKIGISCEYENVKRNCNNNSLKGSNRSRKDEIITLYQRFIKQ